MPLTLNYSEAPRTDFPIRSSSPSDVRDAMGLDAFAAKNVQNRFVELPIRTHLHLSGAQGTELASRNHINVLSSDVVIALFSH